MLSEETIASLAARHGRVKHVTYNGTELVFRKPSRAEMKQYLVEANDPAQAPFADEKIARILVVYPSREDFAALIEDYPLACNSKAIGGAISKLTGLTQDDEAKEPGRVVTASDSPLNSLAKA